MDPIKRAIFLSVIAVLILATGTVGYMIIEGWTTFDALYMTVITVYTVGYNEMRGLSTAGRAFTIWLILAGVGFFFYMGASVIQFMVEGRIRQILGRRKLERDIQNLKNHYIVCGYGRIGRVLCQQMLHKPVDILVIDREERRANRLDKDGFLYILGEATDEHILEQAGLERARGIVAAMGSDTDNVFVVLTAKQLKPDLFIMSRANETTSVPKLKAAGADRVVSPYDIAASRMAEGILRPTVTDFLDITLLDHNVDIQMEEIPISPGSTLAGVTLADSKIRQKLNLIIITIKKPDGSMVFNPSFDQRLFGGDTVIVVGGMENLDKLEKILNPDK